ncbi:MAG: hypothetical protein ACLRZG_07620 [Streptococcus sp.]
MVQKERIKILFMRTGWYEIKSTGASSSEISISSVEQLDRDDEGELVIYRIDKWHRINQDHSPCMDWFRN